MEEQWNAPQNQKIGIEQKQTKHQPVLGLNKLAKDIKITFDNFKNYWNIIKLSKFSNKFYRFLMKFSKFI